MKYTIMIDVSDESQKVLAVNWIKNNRINIIASYGNDGCGCCIDSYHLDCRDEVLSLPVEISCEDDWTSDGKNRCPELTVDEVIDDILRHSPNKMIEG
jgi:hypothetical protein